MERAVILSRGGILQFNLPSQRGNNLPAGSSAGSSKSSNTEQFLTEAEMRQLEKENLLKILEKADWKIKGVDGAAELLGIKPTTLLSRIKKMGLQRPKA